MIGVDAELYGKTSFREWASQFSGEYFVMIQIYADESGTHDEFSRLEGSQYPIIAGFAARKSTWDTFVVNWNAMLKKYDVPYFHGRELNQARFAIIKNKLADKELLKNPYFVNKWTLDRMDSFRRSLAPIAAAGGKIPIAGAINLPALNTFKAKSEIYDFGETEIGDNPYKYCMSEFFRVYHKETALQWGNFKSDVSFFFDRNENKKWRDSVLEVFDAYQGKDPRMRGPYFDNEDKLVQIQAADLLAYRLRQLTEDHFNNRLEYEESDYVLLGNFLKSAPIQYPFLKDPGFKKHLRTQQKIKNENRNRI